MSNVLRGYPDNPGENLRLEGIVYGAFWIFFLRKLADGAKGGQNLECMFRAALLPFDNFESERGIWRNVRTFVLEVLAGFRLGRLQRAKKIFT